jgi:hypothetical protein
LNGFAYASACSTVCDLPVADFGNAAGCPDDSADTDGECAGQVNTWHQSDIYYVAWGGGSGAVYTIPLIYFEDNAYQWAMVSLYAVNASLTYAPIYFWGPMDEYWAAVAQGHYDENTSQDAWDDLWTAINSDPATAMDPFVSLEIDWEPLVD